MVEGFERPDCSSCGMPSAGPVPQTENMEYAVTYLLRLFPIVSREK